MSDPILAAISIFEKSFTGRLQNLLWIKKSYRFNSMKRMQQRIFPFLVSFSAKRFCENVIAFAILMQTNFLSNS